MGTCLEAFMYDLYHNISFKVARNWAYLHVIKHFQVNADYARVLFNTIYSDKTFDQVRTAGCIRYNEHFRLEIKIQKNWVQLDKVVNKEEGL